VNRSGAQTWLDSCAGVAAVNLTGKWSDATEDSWGDADLMQTGNRVSGNLGMYEVDGTVSGVCVNLALKTDDWYYYSVVAVASRNAIEGYYSREFPPELIKGKSPVFRFQRVTR
jgi:hypothetical protein